MGSHISQVDLGVLICVLSGGGESVVSGVVYFWESGEVGGGF